MEQTPAHDFLSELPDYAGLILDVLDSPRKSSWHWPSYYLLYVYVDRLAGMLARVRYVFEPPFAGFGESITLKERTADANTLFALLDKQQKAIMNWLFQMYRYSRADPDNPATHKRLGAHVHPKSGWYQTFMREYRSGLVTVDGASLQRVASQSILRLPMSESTRSRPAACCVISRSTWARRQPRLPWPRQRTRRRNGWAKCKPG